MEEKLSQLHNAMLLIETKGESTLVMADCLDFLRECIRECAEENSKKEVSERNGPEIKR